MAEYVDIKNATLEDLWAIKDGFTKLRPLVRVFARENGYDGSTFYAKIHAQFKEKVEEGVDLKEEVGVFHHPLDSTNKNWRWFADIPKFLSWLDRTEKDKPKNRLCIQEIPFGWTRKDFLKKAKGRYNMKTVLDLVAPEKHPLNYYQVRRKVMKSGKQSKNLFGIWHEQSYGYILEAEPFIEWFTRVEAGDRA